MENKYIPVSYKLYVRKAGKKTLVEEARAAEPFRFLSVMGTTLERFEAEIGPLAAGSEFHFVVPPAEAYGDYVPEGVRTVSKEMFYVDGAFDARHIYKGAVVPLQDNEGHRFNATITAVDAGTVTVDLNHPWAGKDLAFVGKVIESRPATPAEIQEMANALSNEGCCGGGCGSCGGCGGHCR